MLGRCTLLMTALLCSAAAPAQTHDSNEPMSMSAHTLLETALQHSGSGTSLEPASTPVPMMMSTHDAWQLMLHTNIFVANTQQQAANSRGRDAWFSTNWIMPMAQ